jgi:branched-subunit amino acid ABC-type transport system permease component
VNLVPVSITIGAVTTIVVVLKMRSRSRITVAVLIGLTLGVLAGWHLEIVIGVLLQRELTTTSASVFTFAFVLLVTELLARSFLHLEKRFVELPERSAGSRSLAQQKTAAFYLEFDKVRLREGVRTDPRIDFSYWRELMEYRRGGSLHSRWSRKHHW